TEEEIQPRQRQKQLGEAHDGLVDPPAVIAGDRAKYRPERDGDRRGEETGHERYLSSVQQTRQYIAPVLIGAEQEHVRRLVDDEQVTGSSQETGQAVRRAGRHESDRIRAAAIL